MGKKKPMIFSVDKAFNFLEENSFVFTFRTEEPKDVIEKVWIRRSRNGEKEFDAVRVAFDYGANLPFSRYVRWSGFEDKDEWLEAIREFYDENEIFGGIYLVFRVKEDG